MSATSGTLEDVDEIIRKTGIHCPLNNNLVHRLGKKIISEDRLRPRPVRVCCRSESEKWEVLNAINAQGTPGIFARLDLSKEEQERDFCLRHELKEKRGQNPDVKFKIRRGKVVQVNN